MSQLFPTLCVAFVLIAFALLAMTIGYFFNRKKCLKKQCGINPNDEKEGKGKDKGCELCNNNYKKEKKS